MPEANEFTIHIFAALAQQERKMISKRTVDALEAKKKQGVQLGRPENLTQDHRMKGVMVRVEAAREDLRNKQASKLIQRYRKENMTFEQIASELNNDGYRSRTGKLFMPMTVKRLHDRINSLQ
jgi:DNA invertase Pin-like site-specific DNA recombinase